MFSFLFPCYGCPHRPGVDSALITDGACILINGILPKDKDRRGALMLPLGEALWCHTPREMTRYERGGELMFHYVR